MHILYINTRKKAKGCDLNDWNITYKVFWKFCQGYFASLPKSPASLFQISALSAAAHSLCALTLNSTWDILTITTNSLFSLSDLIWLRYPVLPEAKARKGEKNWSSNSWLVKMVLWVALLMYYCCLDGAAAERTELERIEDCHTSCSQVKLHPALKSLKNYV